MYVWPALVLMLMKFLRLKTKTFHLVSFLSKKDWLLVDNRPWKQKDLSFLLRPQEWLLSYVNGKTLLEKEPGLSPDVSIHSEAPAVQCQGAI
jgi:hypothetical protein